MRPSAPWMKNARKSSADIRSIRRQISGQCCGGWSRGHISQPERQQPARKERRRSLIPGVAQRSEAKEEKREKDRRHRRRPYGRGLCDSIRKTNVARCFYPRGLSQSNEKRKAMIDHIYLPVSDLKRSSEFYKKVLEPLGIDMPYKFDRLL